MDVSLIARIITLAEPVQEIETIALTEGCQVVFMDGNEATLRDLRPGAKVEAQGQPGKRHRIVLATKVFGPVDASDPNAGWLTAGTLSRR